MGETYDGILIQMFMAGFGSITKNVYAAGKPDQNPLQYFFFRRLQTFSIERSIKITTNLACKNPKRNGFSGMFSQAVDTGHVKD
jgi:hypothetical protein